MRRMRWHFQWYFSGRTLSVQKSTLEPDIHVLPSRINGIQCAHHLLYNAGYSIRFSHPSALTLKIGPCTAQRRVLSDRPEDSPKHKKGLKVNSENAAESIKTFYAR